MKDKEGGWKEGGREGRRWRAGGRESRRRRVGEGRGVNMTVVFSQDCFPGPPGSGAEQPDHGHWDSGGRAQCQGTTAGQLYSYSGVCCSASQLVILLVQGCLPVVLMFDAYESEERTVSSCEFAL